MSALGTLYVIVPEKLHALWYSPILPYLFCISAIALGLAMVNVESLLFFRAFGKRLEPEILADVGEATAFMLLFYLVLRCEDLIVRYSLKYAFRLHLGAIFFWVEVGVLMIVPMAMMMSDRIRHTPLALAGAQLMVVLGMVFDRMNVSTTAFELGTGVTFHPLWMEFAISIGVVAVGMGLIGLAVRYLAVFPEGLLEKPQPVDPYAALLK